MLELKGHNGVILRVAFSANGTRLVTSGSDRKTKVWDAGSGKELPGEPVPPLGWSESVSRDGSLLAARGGDQVRLVPLAVPADERDRRLRATAPNRQYLVKGFEAARTANDSFAVRFYLDHLIEYAEANNKDEVKKWKDERAKYPPPEKK